MTKHFEKLLHHTRKINTGQDKEIGMCKLQLKGAFLQVLLPDATQVWTLLEGSLSFQPNMVLNHKVSKLFEMVFEGYASLPFEFICVIFGKEELCQPKGWKAACLAENSNQGL